MIKCLIDNKVDCDDTEIIDGVEACFARIVIDNAEITAEEFKRMVMQQLKTSLDECKACERTINKIIKQE